MAERMTWEGEVTMIKQWTPQEAPKEEELKQRLQKAQEKLAGQQMLLKEHKLPVIVLVEGGGAAGKGGAIGSMIKNLDPRFFKVATRSEPTAAELRRPFLYR